ncbi:MAG: tetratricopeptide repeat protein [Betaproteobacteria bacterium]|nr:tetratricopeptide repeat protein [Betaproteobacteria bacterium]
MVELFRLAGRFSLAAVVLLYAATGARAQVGESDELKERAHENLRIAPAKSPEPLPGMELSGVILYQYLLGEIALQRGDPALAARNFLDLARRTRDPRLARRTMEVAGSARLPNIALEAARIWHEADPSSPAALQSVTALLLGEKRLQEAEPYLAKLIASSATNPASAFMQLGRLFAAHPDKTATLRVVQQLAQSYPDLAEAQFAVAQAAHAAEDKTVALAAIRRAGALRPDWEVAALFEAELLRVDAPDEAVRRLARYLEAYPDRKDVRLSYARLLVGARRYAEARAVFDQLLAANPNDTNVLYSVGLIAQQMKDYATAERYMRRLLELKFRDADSVRYALGQLAEDQQKWPEAIAWYEKIGQGESYLPARLRAAQVIAKQGRLDEARAYVRQIQVTDAKQRVQLIVAEAQLLRDARRVGEAFAILEKALRNEPDQPEILYDYALTAEKLQRYDALEEKLRKLIELHPTYAHAYNALGYSFAERNMRLGEARKLIEKALELAPEDYFVIDSMGWVLYRQGDLSGAIRWLRRAYNGRPDGDIGAHLGEALWFRGERDEARRIWDEALKNFPDSEVLQQTIKRIKQ